MMEQSKMLDILLHFQKKKYPFRKMKIIALFETLSFHLYFYY